ncbi:CopG family antitoxin [Komagataeibacter europaeus]|uniref:CopG family antitoxin n=1 Tax=Komagataeibacter europaeus TaxID=33995 RepID=UPI0027D92C3F|nr:CopG family antitoxin [Komagataeibacter europaeus]
MVYEEPMSGRVQCSPECGVGQVPERGRDSAKRGYAVARQKEIDHYEQKNRSMPSLHSDEAVEDFVATFDLTQYDLSGLKPMRFEIEPKAAASVPAGRRGSQGEGKEHPLHTIYGCWRPMSHRRGKAYSDQNRGDRAM